MATVTLKKDKTLLGFAALLVVVVAALVIHGDVTWKEAGAFLAGALALPGLFGSRPSPSDDDDVGGDPPAGGATPLIVGGCLAILACSAAPATPAQSESTKQNTADTTYFLDMMSCRDPVKYPTLAQSEACLSATRLRWHRRPDGGADGSFADGGAQ